MSLASVDLQPIYGLVLLWMLCQMLKGSSFAQSRCWRRSSLYPQMRWSLSMSLSVLPNCDVQKVLGGRQLILCSYGFCAHFTSSLKVFSDSFCGDTKLWITWWIDKPQPVKRIALFFSWACIAQATLHKMTRPLCRSKFSYRTMSCHWSLPSSPIVMPWSLYNTGPKKLSIYKRSSNNKGIRVLIRSN